MDLPSTLRRTKLAIAASLVAVALTACGGGGSDDGGSPKKEFTAAPAKDLPAATDLAADDSSVAAGEWGVVKHGGGQIDTVLAIKITDVKAGKRGELKGVFGANGAATSTPYYVSYSWANISGDTGFSPDESLVSFDGKTYVDVSDNLKKCKIPEGRAKGAAPFGTEQHGCKLLAMDDADPTSLVFESRSGSRRVAFTLPE